MAYSTTNPPQCVLPSLNDQSASIWTYGSADAAALVQVDGYFTDADDLGMKVGDLVFSRDTDTQLTSSMVVITVTAGGAADLGDATTIGDSTNSD